MNHQSPTRQRIYSLDILRGVVMIIMALDHVRDYFHFDAFFHNPLDLNTTTPLLFFTRFITHFCAPVFVFLAGISAFLQSQKKSKQELSGLLIKRGLWLILIELVVVTFAWRFDPEFHLIVFQVIWAIGFSMIVLGLLVYLPITVILITGLIITLGHNALDFTSEMQEKQSSFLYDLFLRGNFAIHELWPGHVAFMVYAGIPWLGMMLLGFCFGSIYGNGFETARRKSILIATGCGLLLLFIALRASNVYGDPSPWTEQKNTLYTFLSFINVTKYPPSLLFVCLMLGPSLLLLAALENTNNNITKVITVYGRVPFFYYIVHLLLIHGLEMILFFAHGHSFSEGIQGNAISPFLFHEPTEGFGLLGVYIVWIVVVVALYFPCKWFNEYKNRKRVWWMSYL